MSECNQDARSSITSLQILSQKYKDKRISSSDLTESNFFNKKGKDKFPSIFDVTEYVLWEKSQAFGTAFIKEVKDNCSALGDYQLLNNSLYHNFQHCCSYFDDNMEKSACFLDLLSRCDVMSQFVFKNQA